MYHEIIQNLKPGLAQIQDRINQAVCAADIQQEFRDLLLEIQQGAQTYDNRSEGFGFRSVNLGNNNWCMTLCLANIALNVCCGGRFLCC